MATVWNRCRVGSRQSGDKPQGTLCTAGACGEMAWDFMLAHKTSFTTCMDKKATIGMKGSGFRWRSISKNWAKLQ